VVGNSFKCAKHSQRGCSGSPTRHCMSVT
jgi:hypothetical protein